MSRFQTPDGISRQQGPRPFAADDGLSGIYTGVLSVANSGGSCRVTVTAMSSFHDKQMNCSASYAGVVGDAVLVAFDENKQGWLLKVA